MLEFIAGSAVMMTVQICIQVKNYIRHQEGVSFFAIESLQRICNR